MTVSATHSKEIDLSPDMRLIRAHKFACQIMHVLEKYIPREDYGRAARDLLAALHESGVDVVTDHDRAMAGLSPRGDKGWTQQELSVLEHTRILKMLEPYVVTPLGVSADESKPKP